MFGNSLTMEFCSKPKITNAHTRIITSSPKPLARIFKSHRSSLPGHKATGRTSACDCHHSREAARRPPHTRWTTFTRHGVTRPLGIRDRQGTGMKQKMGSNKHLREFFTNFCSRSTEIPKATNVKRKGMKGNIS